MKKTILALLLVLCLVCFAAVAVSAEETEIHEHCVCNGNVSGNASHTCESETWTPISEALTEAGLTTQTANIGKLPSGNYYLDTDIKVTGTSTIGSKTDVKDSADTVINRTYGTKKTINICLNGHNITTTASRVFGGLYYGSKLTITDCVGTGVIEGGSGATGTVIYTYAGSTFEIYGGTIKQREGITTSYGLFCIACDSYFDANGDGKLTAAGDQQHEKNRTYFNMYGGTLIGGEGTKNGGTIVFWHNAEANIYGGSISGGKASYGGNLNMSGTPSTMNIYGGSITGGESVNSGGNIYISAGKLNIYGGTISGGKAGTTGGNIGAGVATNITGGSIYGGTAGTQGGDISWMNNSASGITLNCDVGTLNVGGYSYGGLILGKNFSATKITADNNTNYGVVVKSFESEAQLACFEAKNAEDELLVQNGRVFMVKPITDGKHYSCTCGGAGGTYLPAIGHVCSFYSDWQDLNAYLAGQEIADGTIFDLAAGRYYLSADLTVNYYLNIPADIVTSIDLNGYTLTGAAQPTENTPLLRMKSGGELNICDSSYDATAETAEAAFSGSVEASGTRAYPLMYVNGGGVCRVYGGKLVYTGTSHNAGMICTSGSLRVFGGYINGGKSSASGASVCVYDSGELALWGGEITGGQSTTNGGNIYVDKTTGKFSMLGGIVSGGKADNGGNVYNSKGTVSISGGLITGGVATESGGGNIYQNTGSVKISGGTVSGGDALNGGNIYNYDATLTISGGTVSGGTATDGGNIIAIEGNVTVSGGTVSGGTASGNGGNLYISRGTLTVSKGTVTGGTATTNGGNIYLHAGSTTTTDADGNTVIDAQYEAKMTISGGTISGGTAGKQDANGAFTSGIGGNIFIMGNPRSITNGDVRTVYPMAAQLTMTGGTISGGQSKYGGSIEVRGIMEMSGGTVTGGHSTSEGGNIRVYLTNIDDENGENMVISAFTQTGGLITKGTSDGSSGNMHTYGNTQLLGGSMTDGTAKTAGGNLRPFRPTVLTIGADYTISGGVSGSSGGNIAMGGATTTNTYSDYCTVTISGKIENGTAAANGGNLYSGSDFCHLIIDGATITGGTAKSNGDDVYFCEASDLTIKGTTTIGELHLTNAENQTTEVSELSDDASIGLVCGKFGAFATSETDKTGCFTSLQDCTLKYENGTLYADAPKVVFVSNSGSNTNYGTQDSPFKTLNYALTKVEDEGTVRIVDVVDVDAFEKHDKHVTITGGELNITNQTRVELQDHIHFKNMTLTIPAVEYYFYCNGYTTVIDSDVTVRYYDGTNYSENSTNSYIFGGSRGAYQTSNGAITGTDLTVLSGYWGHIYGGNNNCDLTGDVHLTVGGNVNKDLDYATTGHDSDTNSYNRVYGGSRTGDITGTVYMTVTGGKFNSVFGGSTGAGQVDAIELRIEGGEGMAAYGAGRGGAQTVGTVNFYFEGGYFEQVFGGCLSQTLTGDVNMYITGGEIARRLYGGCYNDYGLLSGWSSTHMVEGNIQMFIGENANISCKLTQHSDRGIHGHGRRANATTSDAENAAIIFLTKAAYDKNASKLHATDSTMAAILSNVPAADLICYLAWSADDEQNVISSNATAVADPETGVTGDASAYNETVALTLSGTSFYYNGKAHEPATVTASENWKSGETTLTYANNTEIGTATATLTANGYSVSATFDIVKKDEVAQIGNTKYEYLQDAVNALAEGGYMQILIDCDEDAVISKSIYVDLNGKSLTGNITVNEGAVLYGMDSTTDDYDCTEGYGEITNVTGEVSLQYKTSVTGKVRRYLTYTDPETGAKSFHRIYLGVTSLSLRPAVCGVGYKATFRADHIAQSMLHETEAFGYNLWLDGMETKVSCAKTRNDLDNTKTVTLRIQGMPVDTYGETKVFANVYMKLSDGTMITGTDSYFTLRQMLEMIAADTSDYTETQMKALQDMLAPYAQFLKDSDWKVDSILPAVE